MAERSGSHSGPASGSGEPWERFSHWLCCACVVTFDLELGQALETLIPSSYALTDSEKSNICYLAFPDSNSGCMGDTQFHFRILSSGSGLGGQDAAHCREHSGAPLVLAPDPSHLYGFVYFRQVKDADIKRGYFQKSVVLVTRLPYITFYSQLVQRVAREYFAKGLSSLEAACNSVDQWPSPRPGQILQLPLLGQLVTVRLPAKSDKPGTARALEEGAKNNPSAMVVPSVHDLNLYQALAPLLSNLEMIWELVITNEPLVVMATSPTLCANTVQALVSLIHPLKYASDYRPYFTIHDSEFKYYTTKRQAPPQVILGVTNPFFVKTLEHWPHTIRVGGAESVADDRSRSPVDGSDTKTGVHTKYKAFLHKDKTFAKLIASSKTAPGRRPVEALNSMIKKHALELTTSFVIPLERYLASLMPLKRDVSPWRPPPQLKPFNSEQFLKGMEGAGPHLTSGIKGNWTALYQRFLESPNFTRWYFNRKEEANQKLRLLHLDTLCKADVAFWMRDKQEVEIVDFLIQVRESVSATLQQQPSAPPQTLHSVRTLMQTVVSKLPEDLQSCLTPSFL